MPSESSRPLPILTLPSALLHFWPSAADDQRARGMAKTFAAYPGVTQLGERLLAILPELGREHVFDDAVTLGNTLLSRLRQVGAEGEISGILVFPGLVTARGMGAGNTKARNTSFEPAPDELLEDLRRKPPQFKARGIFLTGHAATWLRGDHHLEPAGLYDGPSGRRVPLHRLVGRASQAYPWHNPELLGRRVRVARAQIAEGLTMANEGSLQVLGTMGTGKSHAVWHFLQEQEGPQLWFRAGRSLFSTAGLTRRLVTELYQTAPRDLPSGSDELRRPESLSSSRAAELLLGWLNNAHQRLGAPLWLVCDMLHTAVAGELDLLAHLVVSPLLGRAFRMVLIARTGGKAVSQLVGMKQVEVPPLDLAELANLGQQLVAGLSMNQEVEKRLVEAAGGYPLALEEGLVRLVHRGLIRRVYGSFFFGGGSDVAYEPSPRLVRIVEAEVRRLGEPLPLRILAAADQAVPARYLDLACGQFRVSLPPGWEQSFLATGWLREVSSAWGSGLAFVCPAYRQALLGTVAGESVESLRQALGQVVTSETPSPDTAWQAYQLLAGSVDALPSLLDLSRTTGGQASREEIFSALDNEYRLHVAREGDQATELDLLWNLLPLGHHLGKLAGLETELARAVELAAEDPTRLAALAMLQAEYEQDQGRYREAEGGIRQALKASEGSDQKRVLVLIRLGKLLRYQERFDDARKIFENVLRVVDRQGPTALGATCRFYLGNIALFERRLEDADEHHGKALVLRRQQNLAKQISSSLSAHGSIAMARGDYLQALDHYRKAQETLAETEDAPELPYALLGAGRALGRLGDYMAATKPLRRGLELRQGRGNQAGEAIARLDVANNHLDLGHVDEALKEARQAHFLLCLLPECTIRGDAERVLGRILMRLTQQEETLERFQEALRIHLKHRNRLAAAIDSSWLLELAIERNDKADILNRSAELHTLIEDQSHPSLAEILYFRLFRAFKWLQEHNTAARDPFDYLRKAYRELLRKTSFLAPELRHRFLFHVPDHQELLDTATEYRLSLPSFSAKAIIEDLSR
ncbi:MAG: hypothetical protein GY856_24140 [bacterium]|nr:hypothetical protein [bacterium]